MVIKYFRENIKDSYKIENIIFSIFFTFLYAVFCTSALKQPYDWKYFLLSYRFFMTIGFLTLGVKSTFNLKKNTISSFLILGMLFQSISGCMENEFSIDFYQYSYILLFFHVLTYRGKFKKWVKTRLLPIIIVLASPLLFKSPLLFSSFGNFVDNFTLPIVTLFLSVLILYLNTKKYHALNQLVEIKTDLNNILKTKLIEAKKEIRLKEKKALSFEIAQRIAHDLRSPLAVLGFITDKVSNIGDRKTFESCLEKIDNMALDLMKVGDVQHDLSTMINLDRVIKDLINEKKIEYGCKDIQFFFENENNDISLRINKIKLIRSLSNILNNAIESLDKKEKIVKIFLSENDNYFVIKIFDNGSGIKPDILKMLNDGHILSTKNKGNGFGIASTTEILNQVGGYLTIKSKHKDWTEVGIYLPKDIKNEVEMNKTRIL